MYRATVAAFLLSALAPAAAGADDPSAVLLKPARVFDGVAPEWRIPQGAEEADGPALRRVVRDQIGRGADWIKVYADSWDPKKGGAATFSEQELKLIVETARSAGVPVAAHALTREGLRR